MLSRLKLLVFLLPILIYFSGCGFSGNESDFGSSTTTSSTTSTTPTVPTVSSTSPADSDSSVAPSTSLTVIFSESMDTTTITTNTSNTTCSGSLQVSSDSFSTCVQMSSTPSSSNSNKTFTLDPASNLSYNTTFKVKVTTDAKDSDGNALASDYTHSTGFTTSSNWLTKTNIPTKRWGGSVGAVIGTKIYQIGGGVVDAADKVVEIYETTTDTWTTGTSLNNEHNVILDAFAVSGGNIYILNNSSRAEVYYPDNDSWSNLNLRYEEVMKNGSVVAFGPNSIYIFGGGSESSDNNSTRKLNTDNHTITLHSNMIRARASGCAETDGSKIYLIGGLNSTGLISDVDVYDPANDTWETKSSTLPNPSKYFGCAYYQNKIYLTGYLNDKIVNVYDLVNDTWSTIESLPSNRSFVSMSIVNGVLYVMAGCCNDNNNNWAYDLK